jgi:hypothetical protein
MKIVLYFVKIIFSVCIVVCFRVIICDVEYALYEVNMRKIKLVISVIITTIKFAYKIKFLLKSQQLNEN